MLKQKGTSERGERQAGGLLLNTDVAGHCKEVSTDKMDGQPNAGG